MSELINRFRNEYEKTKKSLGQHFLTNPHFVKEIAQVAVPEKNASVIEIGPGCGVLTEQIARLTNNLTVIDIDEIAAGFLIKNRDEFFPHIKIINDDFLKVDIGGIYDGKISIAGNLPYNISVKILEYCTNYIDITSSMVFMFQKEVAARISAKPGSKDYSSLSVFTGYFYNINKIRDIGGTNFWPNANVMSTVLQFIPKSERLLHPSDEAGFFIFLRDAFRQKRKTLNNNLKGYSNVLDAIERLGFSKSVRAEQIGLEEFVRLYDAVKL